MNDKPAKPYDDFPLYPHASGQWCKKIAGRNRYFGSWRTVSWREALAAYHRDRDALRAGVDPVAWNSGVTVADACNAFLLSKQRLVSSGDLAASTWHTYRRICQTLTAQFGRLRSVESLTPQDFDRLREEMAKSLNPTSLADTITRIKTIFRHSYENGLIAAAVRFGSDFRPPKAREIRLAKSANRRVFTAAEINAALAAAKPQMRAMILLGINCGFGNSDCAQLEYGHLSNGWLDMPRPKTGIDRRAKLWPETIAAIGAVGNRTEGAIFRTNRGNAYSRPDKRDSQNGRLFRMLLKRIGIYQPGLSFYGLRHTFATVASQCGDQLAVDAIMGHAGRTMAANYQHGVNDCRLEMVADYVRDWLLGGEKV